ncbi:siderophore ABC transporter substrate-binding protein [Evansella sp. AB-P1]|uniref:siderophore ABC transporter substrate-binding protein n=1 Tax=Evansella sp. AB-P1 TaxID=3037653 RepID=UPI00241FB251|nr:siderophore ABC transporter substrate-binding protein [Evansella sp. AB-P1]MDG5785908.1 siderophore ABC transporter substrate-binding protein [Evansella sp. AB-P1]
MKKNVLLLFLALMLIFVLAACGGEQASGDESGESNENDSESSEDVDSEEPSEVTITHEFGEVTVPLNPEKVVVFDMNTLESLDKMGVEVTGVPQANIPSYLDKYEDASYENIGSFFEIDFEKIAEINPDLIVISGRQQEHYDELSSIGPTLYMAIDYNNYLDSFKNNMTILGQIFDQEEFIASELAAIDEAIAFINEKVSAEETGLVVLANQGNVNAYGTGSRFGIIHDEFGITPADEGIEVSTHGMNVSFEYIVDKDPDYLFVVDRDAVTTGESAAKNTIENELVQNTKAYQNDNIYYLDPSYWYVAGGGLVSLNEMVKAIEEALQ